MVFDSIVIPKVKAAPASLSFPQGVASGDVKQHSAILWTRTDRATPVLVEVSNSALFKKFHFKEVVALPKNDFTVKVVVINLLPDHRYYYRWSWGSVISEIGTFKTPPLPFAPAATHFAWSGDSDVSKIKAWKALDSARAEGLDFFIYLGDIIYSNGRQSGVADAKTLVDYRQIYKDSRDVSAIHNLLLAMSIYPVWDDREIHDNWAGLTVDPTIFHIGSKSFYEYMSIMHTVIPVSKRECVAPPQFKMVHWGKGIDLIFIDTRSCRSGDIPDVSRRVCLARGEMIQHVHC
jgi:phosphodiesterase/alkaline phosphatase D-like protein